MDRIYNPVDTQDMDLDAKFHRPAYVLVLIELMKEWGISPERMLEGTNLRLEDLSDPSYRISINEELAVYQRAEQISPKPEWAVLAGHNSDITTHGILGYALMTCADLRQMLHFSVRFYKVSGTTIGAELVEKASGDYELRIMDAVNAPGLRHCVQEEYMTALVRGMTQITNGQFRPKHITFDFPEPEYRALVRDIFNCPVDYDGALSSMLIDRSHLDMRVPTWEPVTLEACLQQCELILEQMTSAEGFVEEVRRILLLQPCDKRACEFSLDA